MGIALLIGCIITLLIAIVRKSALPFIYFLMAILLLLPKFRDVIGLATTRVDEFLVFPLLGLVLLAFSRQRKQNFTNLPKIFVVSFGGYVLLTFISLFANTIFAGQVFDVRIILALFQLGAVFFLVYYALLLEPTRLIEFAKVLFILAGIVAVIGIAQHLKVTEIVNILRTFYSRNTLTSQMGYTRATSVFDGNPVHFGSFIVITNGLLFAWFLWRKRTPGILFILLMIVNLYALFVSGAKWAIIVQIFIILSLFVLRRGGLNQKLLLPAIIVVIIYVGLLTFPTFIERLATFESSIAVRSQTFAEAISVFNSGVKSALFGYGFSNAWVAEGQYFFELYRKGLIGILGFIAFSFCQLIYILKMSTVTSKKPDYSFIIWGGIGVWISFLLLSVSYAPLNTDKVREWSFICLAMVYAYIKICNSSNQDLQNKN
jgi:hypothetical protein